MDFEKIVLKKLSQVSQDATVTKIDSRSSQLKFANNKIVKTGSEQVSAINIFCAINKRVFSTTLREHSEKCLDDLLKKLVAHQTRCPPDKIFWNSSKTN